MLFIILVYLSMLLQRFYSLILPNPGVQIAYNKYMSIYSSLPFKITLYAVTAVCIGYTKSVASISSHVRMGSVTCSVLAAPTRKSGSSEPYTRKNAQVVTSLQQV